MNMRVRTLTFLFTILITACRAPGVSQIAEYPEREPVLPPNLSIVAWNAEKGGDPQFKSDLRTLIMEQQPDFVFLQEAKADLLETNQIGGHFAGSWKYPRPGGPTIGLLTLSRMPPERVQPVPTRGREFLVTAPKLSLITEYPLPNGDSLLAVNVHLLTFERWATINVRAQLNELQSIIAAHRGPVLLAGDFNTWNQKRLDLVDALAEALQLTEVTDFPDGRHTAGLRASFLNWVFGIDKDLPLDRVYYRGFRHHTARVLTYDSSDHRAILVTLVLRSSREQVVQQTEASYLGAAR
jgi:endonuclease/exonuclease/phosphatase (EEP) superfamily protein YafD